MQVPTDRWLHEGIEIRPSTIEGRGMFAREPIAEGEVVIRLGGKLVSREELNALFETSDTYVDTLSYREGIDLVIAPGQDIHFSNHSCDPNIWHVDAFTLAARRDIAPGEEVTLDYATQADDPSFTFECDCGGSVCRGTVTGADWRRAGLQERYADHWVPVLVDRIHGAASE